MFVSATDLPPDSRHHHDVVIVGGGAAGITLAGELSDAGLDVGLAEGGGRTPTRRSQRRYRGPLTVGEGMDYPPLEAYRLRYFGGTTNHWGGWCRPLDPEAMRGRPGVGDGWPFGRDELDPWYEIAHRWCDIGRTEYRADRLGDSGAALAADVGDRLDLQVLRISPPTRFGTEYASVFEPAGRAPTVYLRANCVGIETDGTRATGVTVVDEDGHRHVLGGDAVVIACGGIETVRQLMLAKKAGATIDAADLLGVGWHEHPHVSMGSVLAPTSWVRSLAADCVVRVGFDSDGTPYKVAVALPAEERATLGLLEASFTLSGGGEVWGPHADSVTRLAGAASADGHVPLQMTARAEQRTTSASRIVLSDETDDLGLPRAALDWRLTTGDASDIRRSRDLVVARLIGVGLGPAVDQPDGPSSAITGGAHHMGGARLHESARYGVVDPDLRCHGTSNLFACSAAVFPPSGWSNPTLTVVALAARLAHHLTAGDSAR